MNILSIYDKDYSSLFSLGDELFDGICLSDKNGIILRVNDEYSRILGITDNLVGRNVTYFKEEGFVEETIHEKILKEKQKISRIINIQKNNNIAMITGIPIFNGDEVEQILVVVRDLTEINNLKVKLQQIEKRNKKYLKELNHIKSILKENDGFIGESSSIKKLKELVDSVAKTDVTILITGETGCGKEVLAKEIYKKSNRCDKAYIKVNCAAIPESLIESELFGYEQGAFTGAHNKGKIGLFELANGGTILLDEIGEMPITLQSKLLRVLQEKELTRIGGTKSIKLDIRVIAATNQNLQELVKKKLFRQDLYYRLNVIPMNIIPLRERKEDIVLLSYSFLEKHNLKYNKKLILNNKIINLLESYNWPGNVRELENIIERLVVVSVSDSIDTENLMDILFNNEKEVEIDFEGLTLKEAIQKVEKEMIKKSLDLHGSTYKAAEKLGMNQSSVYRKAKYYEII